MGANSRPNSWNVFGFVWLQTVCILICNCHNVHWVCLHQGSSGMGENSSEDDRAVV